MTKQQMVVKTAAVIRRQEIPAVAEDWPGVRSRWITPPPAEGGWTGGLLAEWELEGAGWADTHPHDEYAFVIEGELHVECAGEEHVLLAGDTICVPAGQTGRYWAPVYARMLGVWGPNPDGETTEHGECFSLKGPDND
ncbi:cupin domain-containing protein [Arthrobacter sp. UCD-GKA]|uniref:cupin domain-containing protein n=1 Tax=Arthrobacter sp. UCD-GKA TaxID=1913576 RepID=UPI00257049BE|nr:cupin domain-containing protein [Arthrobacter sp. UCD-GKA]